MFLRIIYFSTLLLSFTFFIWFEYFNYIFYLSSTDDSIYAQALQHISWNNINPFIPVRQVHIFNDHFDLIILPFALTLAKIFPPLAVGYFLEIFFIFLACCVLFYMYKKELISFGVLTLSTMIIVLAEGTVMAVIFPFHPTTWSIFPLTLLGFFIFKNDEKGIILSYLFLLLFKELFLFCGILLSVYYLYKKNYKLFISLFLISLFWYLLAFHLRYWFWNHHSVNYDDWIFSRLTIDGIKRMFHVLIYGKKVLQHNIILFFPLMVIFIYAWYKKIRIHWLWLLLFSPLYAMNVVMAYDQFWTLHRMAYFSTFIALLVVFTFVKKDIPKSIIVGLFLFLAITNIEVFIKYFQTNPRDIRHLTWSEKWERKKAIDKAVEYLKDKKNSNIFTYINIAPHLTNNDYVFFASGHYYNDKDIPIGYNKQSKYDYLLIEKEPNGNPFDKSFKYMKNLSQKWIYDASIIIDNDYVLLLSKSKK